MIVIWEVIKQCDFLIAIGMTWWISVNLQTREQNNKYRQNLRLLWDELSLTNADPYKYDDTPEATMFVQPLKSFAVDNLIGHHFDQISKDFVLLRTVTDFQVALLNHNAFIPLNNETVLRAGIGKNEKLKRGMFNTVENFRKEVNETKFNLIGTLYIYYSEILGPEFLKKYLEKLPQDIREKLEKLKNIAEAKLKK